MTYPVLALEGVSKRYGQRYAVRDVELRSTPGECVALVGHNGAGKSTLIKMMVGLAAPTAGLVRVLGADPMDARAVELRASIGYLPENVVFPPAMSGREILDFYARLKRQPVAGNGALLERVGLAEAGDRRVATYSKGMRQRLGLAQALLGETRLLLLDEPTTGLDPASRQTFYEIITALRDRGATILLSSHALSEIAERADRIAVMSQARLVACGTLAALRALVDLPVRIRLRAKGGAQALRGLGVPDGSVIRIDERHLELTCANGDKMGVLRRASALAAVADIEVTPPSLDDVYTHLMREAAP